MRVEPASRADLRALLEGPESYTALTGRRVEPGWSSFDGVLEHSLAELDAGVPPEWSTHLFLAAGPDDDGALIGIGGFKGPPDAGTVEIGYEVAPAFRGQGRATAAAHELLARAVAAGCTLVTAHTLPGPNPSTSILRRLGFSHTETTEDPDEGPVWRWERPLA